MGIDLDVVLLVLASPVYAVTGLIRAVRRARFLKVSYLTAIECRSCGHAISLVGIWRCACGFTYKGHVLRLCPVCHSLPRMARCYVCGATEKLPEP